MRLLAIALLSLSLVSARPASLSVPLTHAALLTSGVQLGTNGRALDNPDVAIGERVNPTREIARSDGHLQARRLSLLINDAVPLALTSFAPLGTDGRVVDTPEVAAAKVAHAAAHVNERISLANEAARSSGGSGGGGGDATDSENTDHVIPAPKTTIDPDSRILDTPEVTAARVNERNGLTNEASNAVVGSRLTPLALGNGVIAVLVPVGLDGGPLDAPEVAAGDRNLANDVKSVDALAVAGPALAYGSVLF